jgi:hypothetical protein
MRQEVFKTKKTPNLVRSGNELLSRTVHALGVIPSTKRKREKKRNFHPF